jgi:hypothetical protein
LCEARRRTELGRVPDVRVRWVVAPLVVAFPAGWIAAVARVDAWMGRLRSLRVQDGAEARRRGLGARRLGREQL